MTTVDLNFGLPRPPHTRQPGVPGHLGMALDPSLASATPKARHIRGVLPPPLLAMSSDCVAMPGSSLSYPLVSHPYAPVSSLVPLES